MEKLELTKKYIKNTEQKNSGVKWLGNIPKDWEIRRVKELFDIKRGRVIAKEEMDDSYPYPVYSSQTENNGCMGYINTYDFNQDVLTWTTDGAKAGTVFCRSGKFNCTNVCGVLIPKKKIDSKYYLYSIQISATHNKRLDTNGYKIMSDEMKNMLIVNPHITSQEKIANFLDKKTALVDQIIEKKQKQIELLREKRTAVINHAVTKGLNPSVELVDSGIDWIGKTPKGWKVEKLKYYSEIQEGPGILAEDFKDEGVPLLRIKNLKGNFVDLDGCNFLDPQLVNKKWKQFKLRAGDLLISGSASSGVISEVNDDAVGSIPYTGLIKLSPKKIEANFLKLILASHYFNEQVNVQKTGTAMQHFGPTHLKKVFIAIPPKEDQILVINTLLKKIDNYDKTIELTEQSIVLLQEFKSSLISHVVTGKVKV